MPPITTLTAPVNTRTASPRRDVRAVRFAQYGNPGEPPAVAEVAGDEASLIEELFSLAADACAVPPLAVREVIENLVHADFEGACVSIFDDGASLRVSDCGPGIADKERALQPGFSTACERVRSVVRGVGSGLPIAAGAMEATGGTFELSDNLRGGTVVTLSVPGRAHQRAITLQLTEMARQLMALLLEMAPATPTTLARELAVSLGECGRELVLLEHRGLVERSEDGARSLTASGTQLLNTLF
jgi:anti-sigma regulatory factor (Ser/Thr protein kinase)